MDSMIKTQKQLYNKTTDTVVQKYVNEQMIPYFTKMANENPNFELRDVECTKIIYNFIDTKTNEEVSVELYIGDDDEYLKANPQLSKKIEWCTNITYRGTHVGDSGIKVDDGFKQVLKNVKARHKAGTIDV